ncbi:unnamed protein product [Protopolystoma xenopodis]|uniref:Uncharacterized protein n=1 Tax=Protopolystoma xenopodis TaxID=117903 RepID=A0A448X0U7_9PLAT|nr:unnamed protein product [Protopolystoma xenopodis]
MGNRHEGCGRGGEKDMSEGQSVGRTGRRGGRRAGDSRLNMRRSALLLGAYATLTVRWHSPQSGRSCTAPTGLTASPAPGPGGSAGPD